MNFRFHLFTAMILLCLFSRAYFSQQDSTENGNVLFFNSEPEGASVFIDSLFKGVTPIEIKDLNAGRYKAVLKVEGYPDRSIFVEMNGERVEKFVVMSGDYAILNITTEPAGADFYLNDIKIGQTPLENFRAPIGRQKVSLHKEEYKEASTYLQLVPSKYALGKKLEPAYSIFHFEENTKYTIYVDEEMIPFNSDSAKIFYGEHKFRVKGVNLKNPRDEAFEVEAPQSYKIKIKENYFTLKYILPSMLVPGLGQALNGSTLKGFSIMLGTGMIILGIEQINNGYKSKVNDFNAQKERYEKSSDEITAIENFNELESLAKKANDFRAYYTIGTGVLIAAYVYNLFDVFYNHSTESGIDIYPYGNSSSLGVGINWNIQ